MSITAERKQALIKQHAQGKGDTRQSQKQSHESNSGRHLHVRTSVERNSFRSGAVGNGMNSVLLGTSQNHSGEEKSPQQEDVPKVVCARNLA